MTLRNNEDDYPERLAEWQIAHNADRHALTPEQDRRLRQHNVMLNLGIDVDRVVFAQRLLASGRISDAVDAARDRAWPGLEDGEGY